MAKAKTQVELAERFANGDKEGQVSFLLIQGDVIYNTEPDKYGQGGAYMPIAIRCPEKVALVNSDRKGSQWSDHRKKVMDALEQQGYIQIDIRLAPLAALTDPIMARGADIPETEMVLRENISQWRGRLKDFESSNDAQGVAHAHTQIAYYERKQRALAWFQSGAKEIQGKATLDILVKLPEILEKAIKEKHIDEGEMQRILSARNQVKGLIDEVDKYLALIMMLPAPTEEAGLSQSQAYSSLKE